VQDQTCGYDGRCVDVVAGCEDDAQCADQCTYLTVCEQCVCAGGKCGPARVDGCCEDDLDCDDSQACDPATNACYRVCSSDLGCTDQCGVLTACETCACGGDTGDQCVKTTTPPPACCATAGDCDDGLTCTGDACVANACVSTPNEHGDCLFDGECFSGCFDRLEGCPCDGFPFGGCTTDGQYDCAYLASLWDPKHCVARCGGACCEEDLDCADGEICRWLPGDYYLGNELRTGSSVFGTCVPPVEPPTCWLDWDCAQGEVCVGVLTCPACHRAGEDGCAYAPGACAPGP
jgi:hypothetical protein